MLEAGLKASLNASPTAAFVRNTANTVVFASGAANTLFKPPRQLTGSAVAVCLPDWPLPPGSSQACIADGLGNLRPVGGIGAAVDSFIRISVCDTGCGMSKDVLSQVFEPFFTTKADGEGTGLGLSQVYGFVNQSGGHVRIESEIGRGTSVHLLLPKISAVS